MGQGEIQKKETLERDISNYKEKLQEAESKAETFEAEILRGIIQNKENQLTEVMKNLSPPPDSPPPDSPPDTPPELSASAAELRTPRAENAYYQQAAVANVTPTPFFNPLMAP